MDRGRVYVDNDVSAYSGKTREGYQRLLADIKARRVTGVLTWNTDRLHRSPTELESYITACETGAVPGRMTARITGAVARHEMEHMIERQKTAKLHAARAGRYRGGRRAFG
jgi:site-specific DNA recombinase